MQVIDITQYMTPSPYGEADQWITIDQWKAASASREWVELRMHAKYTRRVERFSVLYQGPGGAMRVEHGGPQVTGPLGCLSAQATVIASTPVPRARYIDVQEGDVLVINGQRMVIVDDQPRCDYPRLVTELEAGLIEAVQRIALQMQEHMVKENTASTKEEAEQHKTAWMLLSNTAREVRRHAPALRAAYRD